MGKVTEKGRASRLYRVIPSLYTYCKLLSPNPPFILIRKFLWVDSQLNITELRRGVGGIDLYLEEKTK